MRAIIITPTDVPRVRDVNGYNEIKEIIGGWLELIPIGNDAIAYIDEEGAIKKDRPPINAIATIIANIPGNYIRGTMLIFGGADKNGNETDVPEYLIEKFVRKGYKILQ